MNSTRSVAACFFAPSVFATFFFIPVHLMRFLINSRIIRLSGQKVNPLAPAVFSTSVGPIAIP
jgi:hypothetical protein